MANNFIAGLELGTSRSVLAMAEVLPSGGINVIAQCSIPSNGMRKSMITNMHQAGYSLHSLVKSMEDDHGFLTNEINLVVSGPHIKCYRLDGTHPVSSSVVTEDDIIAIEEKVVSVSDTDEFEVLDVNPCRFGLDDLNELYEPPKDMHGKVLRCEALVVQGEKIHINNLRAVAENLNIKINAVSFSGICAAMAVLTPQKKQEGTLVIDLGGGTTTYTFWYKGTMTYANVLGVGGEHVTGDINFAFSINHAQAESIKKEYASALVSNTSERIPLKDVIGSKNATISLRALNTVVNARMHELFNVICMDLDEKGLLHKLNGGVVLTGGGAYLKDVALLAETVFGRSVKIGNIIQEIQGLEKVEQPARFASIAGLLYQLKADMQPKKSIFSRILGGVFKK